MSEAYVTYRTIKSVLDNMTEEQLNQEVQVILPQLDYDRPIPLHPIIGLDVVSNYLEDEKTRNATDNQHHPEQFVFLMDWNMFAEDGTIGFNLMNGERL